MNLWGKEYTRAELLERVGTPDQLASAQPFELVDGVERHVRGVRLRNAAGLDFSVIPDRGMGITALSYRGTPLPFLTSVGAAHPAYYDPHGAGWLRTFPAGFLTPCGLTQVGSPCVEGEEELGLHGRVANLPAGQVRWGGEWQAENYVIWAEGLVRQAAFFGEDISLRRRVWARLDEPRFWVEDRVENHSFSPTPLMFLQHINLGFPLVDAAARLELPEHTTQPRDETARLGLEQCCQFHAPQPGYQEQVFYHSLQADPEGQVAVRLVNPEFDQGRGLGVCLRYSLQDYPYLVEWKMMGQGQYVVGLEPANCHVGGRCQEREQGTLQVLAPQAARTFRLEISLQAGDQL